MGKLYIAMYHYTRYLKHSRYPEIKGLDKELFKNQIEFMKNQRIIAGNAQFAGIAAGRGVRFTTGLLLLGKGLGMRETPIRPHHGIEACNQTINMAETERDPRCGEGTGGLFAPEEGIWEEWKG